MRLTLCVTLLLSVSCGDDSANGSTDAGNDAMTATDAPITTPDAPASDASSQDNRSRECGAAPVSLREMWDEPRCEVSTAACIEACGDDLGCQNQQCLQKDGAEPRMQDGEVIDCAFCFNHEPYVCFYANGCDVQMADFSCCWSDACAGLQGVALTNCADEKCGDKGQAQASCFQENFELCRPSTLGACLPSLDADAGAPDASLTDAGADAG